MSTWMYIFIPIIIFRYVLLKMAVWCVHCIAKRYRGLGVLETDTSLCQSSKWSGVVNLLSRWFNSKDPIQILYFIRVTRPYMIHPKLAPCLRKRIWTRLALQNLHFPPYYASKGFFETHVVVDTCTASSMPRLLVPKLLEWTHYTYDCSSSWASSRFQKGEMFFRAVFW